jgi:hypothetical protein
MNRTRLDLAGFRGERNHCSHDVDTNTVQRAKSVTEITGCRDPSLPFGNHQSKIINPLLNLIGGNPDISLKVWVFDVGIVLNSIIALAITGAILFFIFVRPMNHLRKNEAAASSVEPKPSKEELLLTEIRDLLAKQ